MQKRVEYKLFKRAKTRSRMGGRYQLIFSRAFPTLILCFPALVLRWWLLAPGQPRPLPATALEERLAL